MKYYRFLPKDQKQYNWLINTTQLEPPYVILRPRYQTFVCTVCKMFDHDSVFKEGFDSGIKITAKGDFFLSEEGFYCISENVKKVIDSSKIRGLTLYNITETQWYVTNSNCRVEADKDAYTYSKQVCGKCGRHKEITGIIDLLRQINVPSEPGTIFSPVFGRGGSKGDRDYFVTEDVVTTFIENNIKGGWFQKLLTPDEEAKYNEVIALKKPYKWPKGSIITI